MKLALCVSFLFAVTLSAQDALTVESVTANRALWPKEVTISVPHQVSLVVSGKPSGSMKANAGRVYPLKSVDAKGVHIEAMGQAMIFPVADTDLLARAAEKDAALKAVAAAAPAATPPATQPQAAAALPKATPTTQSIPAPSGNNSVAKDAEGSLVALDGKELKPFDAASLASKKYLAIYYSASWCGPCRQFTPKLVSWYKKRKDDRDKFDIIFVSSDRNGDAMQEYMIEDKMAWPAVKFDQASKTPLRAHSGRGIPCLVLLDENGKVLSHSYEGTDYVGPDKVLKDLDKLLRND